MNLFKRRQSNVPERRRLERQDVPLHENAGTFRRGRTLTGSASSSVRTLSEAGADLKSSRVQAHALLRKRRRISTIFAVVCVIALGLYILMSQFTARPVVQASPDPSVQLEAIYAEAIDGYLSDHIGQRLRLFTDADRLTRYVQTKAPEVERVTLRGSAGFGESLFEVTFRKPIASWDISGSKLYVDTEGIPFGRNYYASPKLRIVDQNGLAAPLSGQGIMSNRFMSHIGQIIGLSKKQGYTVTSITIPEGMTRQIEVHVEGVSYPIKFSSDRTAGEGVADMVSALRWMDAKQFTPEYVDVRVGGKVFYK